MPVATENPFKVNSMDSSKRPLLFMTGEDPGRVVAQKRTCVAIPHVIVVMGMEKAS